jgi:hypothetical protein
MTKPKINIPPALKSLSNSELAKIFGCSPQAVLFARRRAEHQCVKCGSPVEDGSQHCRTHQTTARKYMRSYTRKRNGFKPWQPGKPGRIPLTNGGN